MIRRFLSSDNQRTKLLKLNIILGFIIRGISIVISLLLVPMTIGYINSELYGIWLTLSSVIHWISFFDVGFGNGLRNKLAVALAENNEKKARVYVSTTYAVMISIFVPAALLGYYLIPIVDWAAFLNVSTQYNETLILSAQIIIVAFSMQLILKLLQNVAYAYQYSAMASSMEMFGSALSLGLIFLLTKTIYPDLALVALVFAFSPVVVLIICSIFLYSTKFKKVSPHYKFIEKSSAKDLFNLGWEFFILQIAAIILFQMVNILISRMSGPEQVTNYNVAYKYLGISIMVISIILTPIWSAFTEAYTKKDLKWMTLIYNKLLVIFGLAVMLMVICVFISPLVYQIWLGDKVSVPLELSILVGVYSCLKVWGNIHATIINGTGKIRVQLYLSIGELTLFLPTAYILGLRWGVIGILIAMIVINVPGAILCRYQVNLFMKDRAHGIFNK